jgi:hypothetical protein
VVRKRTMAALAAAALLAVSACGDDGDEGSSPDEEGAAPEFEQWELPGEFCADTQVIRERYSQFTEGDPDDREAAGIPYGQYVDAMLRVTPADEIADDWETLMVLFDDETPADSVDPEAVGAASANIETYLREQCGFTFGDAAVE